VARPRKLPPNEAGFIEPMECLPVARVPEGPDWSYELKLDGYRLEAVRNKGQIKLFSRRGHELTKQFSHVVGALAHLPAGTVIDGELVALAQDGRPNFNLLQNYRSADSHIIFYAFDILVLRNQSLMGLPLAERRTHLERVITPGPYVDISQAVTTSAEGMINFVRAHGMEGIVAKRNSSAYQPGKRTGLWVKRRINAGQEFVIGGFIPSDLGVDSLVIGFYRGTDLIYAGRVRAGFVPATRRAVYEHIKHLSNPHCPFVNLPEKTEGRWGQGLTAEKMKKCIWVRPEAIAQVEFLQWTEGDHLRHTKFIDLRDDKDPREIVKEI
jgi:DNA ligase D-like protein (predicted ligase)